MYTSMVALRELDRLNEISKNRKISEWEDKNKGILRITSLNSRSLNKHYEDIRSDTPLLKSDIICLQETWLEEDTNIEDLKIPDYDLHLNSKGKEKGIAIYFKQEIFKHIKDIKQENMQLSKFESSIIDIVVIYRSQDGNYIELRQNIESMTEGKKPELVIGDLNFCYQNHSSNPIKKYFNENDFSQLIQEPTHIEGNLLDHAYKRDTRQIYEYSTETHSKYYSDHKGLAIIVKKSRCYFTLVLKNYSHA